MNIPGFTAEASLYNGNVRYQSTTEATVYGGLVQPASDLIYQDRPYLYRPFRWNCLKYVCCPYVPPEWPLRVEQKCRWVQAIC
jgi:hypothetical protein